MALPPTSDSSVALVTGASSGIGDAIARELASRGHGLVLAARREGRLRTLAGELAREHGVRAEVVPADLEGPGGRDAMAAAIGELDVEVEILVNNAGFGDSDDFVDVDRERLVRMIELNCVALTDLQSRYLRPMVQRGRGAVINIASAAAFQPLPGNAVYAATKAFVLSMSEATHSELAGTGVTVTAVCPGPVRTEFVEEAGFEGAEDRTPGAIWMDAPEVAKTSIDGAHKGKRVVVPGLLNRASTLTGQHSPRALLLPIAKRVLRRSTPSR